MVYVKNLLCKPLRLGYTRVQERAGSMCGICGKINYNSDCVPDRALIERTCAAVQQRGPDDNGVYGVGQAALGHCRLSIIDLSSG